jgi:NDP-sugar pyrophosphorylase family protein
MSMQMVILAGGLGTRLRSVAPATPKILVPVAGRPFVEHQFALLRRNGIERVLLCVGHLGETVEAQVGAGSRWGLQVSYAHEDPTRLLGTGGALLNALPQLESEFLVMYGDSYLPVDYAAFAAWFQSTTYAAAMTVFRNEGRWDPSNTRIEGDRVVFYSKKAAPGEAPYIDYGLSAYRRETLDRYRGTPLPLDLAKVQGDLVQAGCLGAYEVYERFYEVGKPEGLAELDQMLKNGTLGPMDTNR